MAEYIERETLLQDISETVVFTVSAKQQLPTTEMRGANKVINRIKSAPTADVVEVKHGYWKHCESPLGWRDVDVAMCSVCGEEWVLDEWDIEDFTLWNKYCSSCGAKMDKESEVEENAKEKE